VDSVPTNTYQFIKKSLPQIKIVQVIHVQNLSAVEQAMAIDEYVDAILLDSGDPYAEVRKLGGTGKTHNWEISKQLVEEVNSPVFLAGGLTPDNVVDAVSNVQPYGVDICSGVRIEGKLDKDKLTKFINNVKSVIL
ncbi:MAG: phosphoribosylanthranilate isomerase, partial [Ignavibacteria bacterium]